LVLPLAFLILCFLIREEMANVAMLARQPTLPAQQAPRMPHHRSSPFTRLLNSYRRINAG
jgi:hypothetical protein